MITRPNLKFGAVGHVIVAGEHFATRGDALIETVLGSCVAVCLRDPEAGVSGMNHFLLPGEAPARDAAPGRYGAQAMANLIGAMRALGASPERMEAKVFGGGVLRQGEGFGSRVGEYNVRFALDYLTVAGIPVLSRDVGDEVGRRIVLFADTGVVKVRRVPIYDALAAGQGAEGRKAGAPA